MQRILFALLFIISCFTGTAQNNPRPSRSRFWNAKESTFNIKAGDILVYHVSNKGDEYAYIVTLNKVDDGINYSYSLPTKNTNGNVSITASALNNGVKYQTDFTGNYQIPLWISTSNYRDLATNHQTMMDMGGGVDTFVNKNTSTIKINYKGKEKIITVYNVQSMNSIDKKNFAVLNELNNPLIVSINEGFTLTLKEVR